jgi:hypothetical protein
MLPQLMDNTIGGARTGGFSAVHLSALTTKYVFFERVGAQTRRVSRNPMLICVRNVIYSVRMVSRGMCSSTMQRRSDAKRTLMTRQVLLSSHR